ncbi:MAG: SCO family protein [Acidobacteriia bacterium]|nr:SCO family protein [Terriglobia bacterium]
MRNSFSPSHTLVFILALLPIAPGKDALGQKPAPAAAIQPAQKEQLPVRQTGARVPAIPDVAVVDQDNRKLHFYSDLVQGKAVAINFIFTTCTTICPPLTANFARIQKMMRTRGDTDLQLISISVDPENDTPERLKSYATLFHAQPGWTFVTGSRGDLEKIWKAFNISLASKQDHPPTVAIGNEPQHVWVYASGLTTTDKLMGAIIPVLGDRKSPSTEDAANSEAAKALGSKPL